MQILELKNQMEAHKTTIQRANFKLSKLHKKASKNPQRGCPPRDKDVNSFKKGMIKKWIESLQETLGVKGFSGLENIIEHSDQRSWGGWSSGRSVLTSKSLLTLLGRTVKEGKYENSRLIEIPTVPSGFDMFNLICYTYKALDGEIKFE